MSNSDISKKLMSSRKELLDIGLRNNLLNFQKTAKSLMVVDELSEQVLNILYRQAKVMTFSALSESARKQLAKNIDEEESSASEEALLHELGESHWSGVMGDGEEVGTAKRHVDTKLQTALSEERLFLQLLKIHSEANCYIEEQGVNTLFVALGFLYWYEADSTDKVRKAPLLLVPVQLERSGAKESFKLRYTDDDLVENLSLAAKLKIDFALDLPKYRIDEDMDAAEAPELATFFHDVADTISKQRRWRVVENEIALGFFSFGKFLMFKDLDPKIWPEEKQPRAHGVLARLLGDGFGDSRPLLAPEVHLDTVISPGQVHFVKDADSSQTEAILESRAGANLVIQGPPGTGKSQTITNIIAEQIGQGKTVLFVAEKMAALEVVKRRLDECHLGDAVLELHSHKATKTSVLKELGRTLEQGQPIAKDGAEDLETLKQLQDTLNDYCKAVNASAGASGLPFIDVLGHYLRLKRLNSAQQLLPFAPMCNWSLKDQLKHRNKVTELAMHLQGMGSPAQSPFFGSDRTHFSPVEQHRATEQLAIAIDVVGKVTNAATSLSTHLGLADPANLVDIDVVCRAAKRAAAAPRLEGLTLATNDWQIRRESISELIDAGKLMSQTYDTYCGQLIDAAWDQDLIGVRQHFATYGEKWWRVLSGKYRSSKFKLQGFYKGSLPKHNSDVLALVDAVLDYQHRKNIYDQHAQIGAALFGAQWNRLNSDWEVLERLSAWVIQLHDDLGRGELPPGIMDFLLGHADASGLGGATVTIEQHVSVLQGVLTELVGTLGFRAENKLASFNQRSLSELGQHLSEWQDKLPAMYQMARFNVLSKELTDTGLADVVNLALATSEPEFLVHTFDLSWYAGLVEHAYATNPSLQQFDRVKHQHLIQRFRELDKASLGYAQISLAKRVWQRMPNVNQPGEMAVLRNELNKKRRHLPIRQLMEQAGRAIQQIKPVFMMSPMSIANFLPPGRIEFDVVVFDEASQVKAVDAFGAILRGKQVIVVGDTRQMPPSDFFGRDVDLGEEDNVTGDIESVLSMFKMAGAQERYLQWHYRSRHESLIAVSNVEFYESKLIVFPTSGANPNATGLRFHHLPDALYDRGRTRTNKGEAKAVAATVIEHALATPNLSLGVVAFSVVQRDLIQIEVELLRQRHPETENFFISGGHESFFIKNLENVQGDERDVIFISIGYGRNESGRIAKEFGPVNREGGHRRLNVLITRAKLAMAVFCNFRADELELDAGTAHGVRALKHFLYYAETGKLDLPHETGGDVDSPFEAEVITALRDLGYQVEPQVGNAGYYIDIGVKDPEYPGRYILAIECDGAAYHSSRSARDRDRLRQGVLEGLGWRFHRIWSTDWFRNPNQEINRAIEAIEQARKDCCDTKPLLPSVGIVDHTAALSRAAASEQKPSLISAPYQRFMFPHYIGRGVALHDENLTQLAQYIKLIVEVEAPIHESEVTRRLMDGYGVSRAGNRIIINIQSAIRKGGADKLFHYHQQFLYLDHQKLSQIRNRSAFTSADRNIEYVAPEEIDMAVLEIVRLGFSMPRSIAISEVLSALGFGRSTEKISAVVNHQIDSLLSRHHLALDGEQLTISTKHGSDETRQP